jgi:protein arginine kinase activator
MTPCEHCHDAPATVHITQITDNQTMVSHLCETCAREKGVIVEIGQGGIVPEVQVKADALVQPQPQPAAEVDKRECRHCHLTFSEFKATARLGCPRCYEEFDRDIDALFMQVHGASVHKGKRHIPRAGDSLTGDDLARLSRELEGAIEREEFELAAMLRDTIQGRDSHREQESLAKNEKVAKEHWPQRQRE